jgi:hypothetical protein
MLHIASAPAQSERHPQRNTAAQKLMKKTDVNVADARKIRIFCVRDDSRTEAPKTLQVGVTFLILRYS